MKIACPHHSREPGNRRHGICALGKFGGTPYSGQCLACLKVEKPLPRGLGDLVERVAKPIAKALRLPCLDENHNLRPESPCAKRRDRLNKAFPFGQNPK